MTVGDSGVCRRSGHRAGVTCRYHTVVAPPPPTPPPPLPHLSPFDYINSKVGCHLLVPIPLPYISPHVYISCSNLLGCLFSRSGFWRTVQVCSASGITLTDIEMRFPAFATVIMGFYLTFAVHCITPLHCIKNLCPGCYGYLVPHAFCKEKK